MNRVYYLETDLVGKTKVVRGSGFIHDALLEIEGKRRKLTMDTTPQEHAQLSALAVSFRETTEKEQAYLVKIQAQIKPPS